MYNYITENYRWFYTYGPYNGQAGLMGSNQKFILYVSSIASLCLLYGAGPSLILG